MGQVGDRNAVQDGHNVCVRVFLLLLFCLRLLVRNQRMMLLRTDLWITILQKTFIVLAPESLFSLICLLMVSGVQVEAILTVATFFKITYASIRKAINLNIPSNPLQQIMCTIHIGYLVNLKKK